MNALNAKFVPVKTSFSALAQLVGLFAASGITSNAELMKITGYSKRAIQAARQEIESEEGVQWAAWGCSLLHGGCSGLHGGVQPAASGNLSHGEKACEQPTLYTDNTYCNGTVQSTQPKVASSVHTELRAREDAGPPLSSSDSISLAGSSSAEPHPPPPSPKVTLGSMIDRLAPMLPGEKPERYAEEVLRNLMHAYDGVTVNKAITRLVQRRLDGYEIKSFSRMLEALCGDVEASVAAGNKARDERIPIGAIPLPGGGYVSRWS